MRINYNLITIPNDFGNNGYLFSHKIVQFLKINFNIDCGSFYNTDTDTVELRIENPIELSIFKSLTDKEIIQQNIDFDLNDGDCLNLVIGFKPNHIKNLEDKSIVDSSHIDKLGYFPSAIFDLDNNELKYYISKKSILSCKLEKLMINHPEKIKISYFFEKKERRFSVNKQSFLLLNIFNIDEMVLKQSIIYGLGIKKSYGFSKIVKI